MGKGLHPGRFSIHEEIICARSEFFKRALNGKWTESEERVVKLPEDDPKTFSIYTNLVYTGLVLTDNLDKPRTVTTICDEFDVLGKLYVLCEKLQDRAAKNSAVESLLEVSEETDERDNVTVPRFDTIMLVYQGTCAGSLGRRLVVELWRNLPVDYLTKCSDKLPKEFLADLVISMKTQLDGDQVKVTRPLDKDTYMEKDA